MLYFDCLKIVSNSQRFLKEYFTISRVNKGNSEENKSLRIEFFFSFRLYCWVFVNNVRF